MGSLRSNLTIRVPDDTEEYELVDATKSTAGHNGSVKPGRGFAGAVLGGGAAPASVLSGLDPSVSRIPPADADAHSHDRAAISVRGFRTWTPILQAILEEDIRDAMNALLPGNSLPSIGTTTATVSSSRQTTPAMTTAAATTAPITNSTTTAKNTQSRRRGVWTCCKCKHLNAAFESSCLHCRTFLQAIHLRCTECGGFGEDPDPDTSRRGGAGAGAGGEESDSDNQAQDGFVVISAHESPAKR